MLLRGQNNTVFEIVVLRYEHPSARKDDWNRNLLRATLFLRTTDGKEGRNRTYLLTKELKWLRAWFDSFLQRRSEETHFEFYYGKCWFDVLEMDEEKIILRVTVDFSGGKESQLPPEREELLEWSASSDFVLSSAQIEAVISSLEGEITLFPERSSKKR